MPRRISAALVTLTLAALIAGCSSDSSPTVSAATSSAAPTTSTTRPAARTTLVTTTIPGTSVRSSTTTVARASTTTSTGAPSVTTADESTSSTHPPAAPCNAAVLLTAADHAFGPLPPGAVATEPRCVENYASALLTAPGQDNAFVVFNNVEGEWEALNLGTDQVCSGAPVPTQFYGPLGCGPWES